MPLVMMPRTRNPIPQTFTFDTWPTHFNVTNGGQLVTRTTDGSYRGLASIQTRSTGKWYAELTANNVTDIGAIAHCGVSWGTGTRFSNYIGASTLSWGYWPRNNSGTAGRKMHNNVSTDLGVLWNIDGSVAMIALNLDDMEVYFGVNGTWQGGADPSTGTNPAFTGLTTSQNYSVSITTYSNSEQWEVKPLAYSIPSGYSTF